MVFCCFYSCCVCDCGMRQLYRERKLLTAAKKGDASVVGRLCIELRVDPNCKYFMSGRRVLHVAAMHGQTAHVELMMHYGARIDATDRKGRTALHYAAENGHLDTCKMLLDRCGAEIDALADLRVVPLHLAAASGHMDVCKYLIAAGANPLAKDNKYYTPQTYAYHHDHHELYSYLHKLEEGKRVAWGLK